MHWKTPSVAALLAFLAGSVASAQLVSGPEPRSLEDSAVLGNPVSQVGTVVETAPLDQPGRYRLTVRARIEKLGRSLAELAAVTRGKDGQVSAVLARRPLYGIVFEAPMQWREFRLDFEGAHGAAVVPGVFVLDRDRRSEAGHPPAVRGWVFFARSRSTCSSGWH
jgi:hypothetical protein